MLGIPFWFILRKIKKNSEFHTEPFRRREKHSKLCNFVPSLSIEHKKCSEFCFEPFHRKKITRNKAKEKTFGNLFQTIEGQGRTLGWLFLQNVEEFCSVATFRTSECLFRDTRIPRKEHFFCGITKTIQILFLAGTEFWCKPTRKWSLNHQMSLLTNREGSINRFLVLLPLISRECTLK